MAADTRGGEETEKQQRGNDRAAELNTDQEKGGKDAANLTKCCEMNTALIAGNRKFMTASQIV